MTAVVGFGGFDGPWSAACDGPAVDEPRWELASTPWGAGAVLVAVRARESRAWAPPGVALGGRQDEPVHRWRFAVRTGEHAPEGDGAAQIEVRTLSEVLTAVPSAFHEWALDATRDALDSLALYIRSGSEDDDALQTARAGSELLERELNVCRTAAAADDSGTPSHGGALEADGALAMLSDVDFEQLVATVLDAEFSIAPAQLEWWRNGQADVRHDAQGAVSVMFYCQADMPSAADLVFNARREAWRLGRRAGDQLVYWFVTSMWLQSELRTAVTSALERWVPSSDHVLGAGEIRALANKHRDVSRRHVKYWLACAARMSGSVTGSLWPSGQADAAVPRLVQTAPFERARHELRDERAVVITGGPGTGKTTLAIMLVADAALDGYQPVLLGANGQDLDAALRAHEPCAVVIDDLDNPGSIPAIVELIRARGGLAIVALHGAHTVAHVHLTALELSHYERRDRALMVYNRLWHGDDLDSWRRRALTRPHAYRAIIDDPRFTPRWCEEAMVSGLNVSNELDTDPDLAVDEVDDLFDRLRRREPHAVGPCHQLGV